MQMQSNDAYYANINHEAHFANANRWSTLCNCKQI